VNDNVSTSPVQRRVRAVITNNAGQFLAVVNNRVTLGCLTIMLPGGEIGPGESELTALARYVRDEVGMTVELSAANCRFLNSRTYEFGASDSKECVRINSFSVDSDCGVPRNMQPESVLSVSWMTLADVKRYLELDGSNWRIQLGALDAIETALDPAKAKVIQGEAREIARQDGGKSPDGGDNQVSRPSRLPYGV
jgi:hypothetical protein